MTKIKICGLKTAADIEMVNELKPDFCGFIIDFPKSHRSKTPDEVRELASKLDREQVTPVGVFVDEPVEKVAGLLADGSIELAQLHGNEDEAYIERLRKLLAEKGVSDKTCIIKAFQIKEAADIDRARASSADIILLDQGQGSGENFDWSLLKGKRIDREWMLAGGLNEKNINEAIAEFAPYAVDLSSAVETDNAKDYEKVKRIIELVQGN